MYTQPRNLSSGDSSGPGRCCGWGEGEHNRSRASWVNNVGTAPAHERWGRTRDRWLTPKWTNAHHIKRRYVQDYRPLKLSNISTVKWKPHSKKATNIQYENNKADNVTSQT